MTYDLCVAVPVEDASLGDDVLQSMYATTEVHWCVSGSLLVIQILSPLQADNDIVPEPSSQPMCLSR